MYRKSNSPFFSIVTCTKNSAQVLESNIKSVLGQTFTNYEHIIIDGNSDDGTAELISKYVRRSARVKRYLQRPGGISRAMNMGIAKARGKYVIHLHADDWLHSSQVLKKVQGRLIQMDEPDWVYGQIRVVNETGFEVGIFPKYALLQKASGWLLLLVNYIPHQAVFIKTEVFKRLGIFDERLKSSMDYDMWLRIFPQTRWKFIPVVVSNYRVSSHSQSSARSNIEQNLRYLQLVQRRHLPAGVYEISRIINMIFGWIYTPKNLR